MKLKLERPIAFFDLEATGINVTTDRIVEISILKLYPNQNKDLYTRRINPEMEIPEEASAIHGIYNKDVATEPTFKDLAPEILEILKDCDLAGFNSNHYDIPLLAEEFLRTGFSFDIENRRLIDVQAIFHKKERRTLEAAYKFYCDKNLDNAHSAEADIKATQEILLAQLERYDDLEADVDFLHEFSKRNGTGSADLAGRIGYNEQGEEIFNFGKYKDKKVVDVFKNDPGYFSWIMNSEFPLYTKEVLRKIKERNS
jgi:DNA polymerase III subunit epsilon